MTLKLILFLSILLAGSVMAASFATPLTEKQGDAILDELRSIRILLQQQGNSTATVKRPPPAPQIVELSIKDRPFIGSEKAPLILVEFSDYQCPFCRRFHLNTFPKIKQEYIDTGKVRYVSLNLPLDFHANAQNAANAAHCAGDQDRFWEMRHLMIKNASKLETEHITDYAKQIKLDMVSFGSCLAEKPHQPLIDADMLMASKAGLTGTPSFVLSSHAGKSQITGHKLIGAQPYDAFKSALESELKRLTQQPSEKVMNSANYRLQKNSISNDSGL